MFVIRFDFDGASESLYAMFVGRHSFAGSWGFGPLEQADTFDSYDAASSVLADHYGSRQAVATILDLWAAEQAPAGGEGAHPGARGLNWGR